MFGLDLIAFAKISTDSMKRYGERKQPCLTPLCGLKKLLDHFRIIKCSSPVY